MKECKEYYLCTNCRLYNNCPVGYEKKKYE